MSRILRTLAREGGAFTAQNKVLHFDLPSYGGQYRNLSKHYLVLQFDPKVGDDTPYNWGFGAINDSDKELKTVGYNLSAQPQKLKLIKKTDIEFYDNKALFRNVWLDSSKKGRLCYEQFVNILNANINKYRYDTDDENWLSLWGNKKLGIDSLVPATTGSGIQNIKSNNQFQSLYVDYDEGSKPVIDNNGPVLIVPLSDLMDIASCDAMSCDEFGDLTVSIELESVFPIISELYNPDNLCEYELTNPANDTTERVVNLNNCFTHTQYYTSQPLAGGSALNTTSLIGIGTPVNCSVPFVVGENQPVEKQAQFVGNGMLISPITQGQTNAIIYQAYECIATVVKNGVETVYSGLVNCAMNNNLKLDLWGTYTATAIPEILVRMATDEVLTLPAINAELGTTTVNDGYKVVFKMKPLEQIIPYSYNEETGDYEAFIISNGSTNLYLNQKILTSYFEDTVSVGGLDYSNISLDRVKKLEYDKTNKRFNITINAPTNNEVNDLLGLGSAVYYARPLLNGIDGATPITRPDNTKWAIQKAEMVEVITSMSETARSMFEANVGLCSRYYRSWKVEPFLLSATNNFVRQFQIEPETVACLLMTPTGTGQNTCMLSKENKVVSYTVVLDGMQTTNRDITLLDEAGVATGAIHQDRLMKTMEEVGIEVKQIQEQNQKIVVYPERIQLLERFNPNGSMRTIQFNLNSGSNQQDTKMIYLFKSILKAL